MTDLLIAAICHVPPNVIHRECLSRIAGWKWRWLLSADKACLWLIEPVFKVVGDVGAAGSCIVERERNSRDRNNIDNVREG